MRIKNQKQFRGAIKILVSSALALILIIGLACSLKTNGLDSMFTTNLYQAAFEENEKDNQLIDIFTTITVIFTLYCTKICLKENVELCDLEREEEELCGYLISQ